ncbi:MAG: T9SS type A sorting domain-containing protein, partial [Hymenobacteraceae bacterium]|nr:T9SS type A sorting domain-containing protein [Hymenobacteraceae bacterium]
WSQPDRYFYPCFGNALLALPDGGMLLIGGTSDGNGVSRGTLWRFTPQGDTLWSRSYFSAAPADEQTFRGGCRLPDGGFALVGESAHATGADVLLLRTDADGRERWRRTYDQDYIDGGGYVLPTADGGLLISGGSLAFATSPPSPGDALLIKVDALGQQQWRTSFGGRWRDASGPLLATPDGGYVVSATLGDTVIGITTQFRFALCWFDAAGTLVRQRTYGPMRPYVGATTLLPLADGGYLLAGQTSDTTNAAGPGLGEPEGFLLRVCADGDSVWYRTYKNLTGGYSSNYLRAVQPTADGGFIGVGFLHPRAPDTGTQDAWVFKTDANGYLQPGGAPPGVTCRPVGLPEAEAETDAGIDVWPNPAPDGRFRVRTPARATLTVTDALGRLVWRGVAQEAETGVDLSRHPPGVYVLRVRGLSGHTTTHKLLR